MSVAGSSNGGLNFKDGGLLVGSPSSDCICCGDGGDPDPPPPIPPCCVGCDGPFEESKAVPAWDGGSGLIGFGLPDPPACFFTQGAFWYTAVCPTLTITVSEYELVYTINSTGQTDTITIAPFTDTRVLTRTGSYNPFASCVRVGGPDVLIAGAMRLQTTTGIDETYSLLHQSDASQFDRGIINEPNAVDCSTGGIGGVNKFVWYMNGNLPGTAKFRAMVFDWDENPSNPRAVFGAEIPGALPGETLPPLVPVFGQPSPSSSVSSATISYDQQGSFSGSTWSYRVEASISISPWSVCSQSAGPATVNPPTPEVRRMLDMQSRGGGCAGCGP